MDVGDQFFQPLLLLLLLLLLLPLLPLVSILFKRVISIPLPKLRESTKQSGEYRSADLNRLCWWCTWCTQCALWRNEWRGAPSTSSQSFDDLTLKRKDDGKKPLPPPPPPQQRRRRLLCFASLHFTKRNTPQPQQLATHCCGAHICMNTHAEKQTGRNSPLNSPNWQFWKKINSFGKQTHRHTCKKLEQFFGYCTFGGDFVILLLSRPRSVFNHRQAIFFLQTHSIEFDFVKWAAHICTLSNWLQPINSSNSSTSSTTWYFHRLLNRIRFPSTQPTHFLGHKAITTIQFCKLSLRGDAEFWDQSLLKYRWSVIICCSAIANCKYCFSRSLSLSLWLTWGIVFILLFIIISSQTV